MAIRPIDFSNTFLAGKKLQINTLIKALRYSSLRFISLGTGKALGNYNKTLLLLQYKRYLFNKRPYTHMVVYNEATRSKFINNNNIDWR